MSTLNFQFEKGILDSDIADLLDNMRKAGATSVRPMFPGDGDPDLATLYVVECADKRRFQVLLSTGYPVKFVEEQVRRKQPATPPKAPRRIAK